MKQLKQLILLISCLFLMPVLAGKGDSTVAAHDPIITSAVFSHAAPHLFLSEKLQRFSYRTRALNDFHQYFVFVSSIRIKTLFVFIHPRYKGYTQSYISVAVSLNHWRGPPTA